MEMPYLGVDKKEGLLTQWPLLVVETEMPTAVAPADGTNRGDADSSSSNGRDQQRKGGMTVARGREE